MKKTLYVSSLVSVAAMLITPMLAVALTNVNTGFTRSTAGGDPPYIKVKWEMRNTTSKGLDDSPSSGAQFLPSGKWGQDTPITYCAVASDPDGLDDVSAVYADVYYPDVASSHGGCMDKVGDEIRLVRKTLTEGWTLLCDTIRNGNVTLPVWATGFNYDEVCALDGQLKKETAAVYCGSRDLSFEAPAGDYTVKVHAVDVPGLDSRVLSNTMTYLPVTAFDVDFTSVSYGNVKLNTHKIVNGNLNFSPGDGLPTVRNTGNTNMSLLVRQNDMGLGKTEGSWNVRYDGRVGSDATFVWYDPDAWQKLPLPLELSETDEVDFSILVTKFPLGSGTNGSYTGTMTLDADDEEFVQCED